ncbi:MAG: hypothetical protein VB878_10800 [Pirellulaceae bacterium]
MRITSRLTIGAVVVVAMIGCRGVQGPKTPVTTYWKKLGIPQAMVGVRDGFSNRKGNRPGLERKAPQVRIVDAPKLIADLGLPKSDLLGGAADVKIQEDLKDQKIEAIKYLTEVGCGCYNDDGSIEAAMLESLNDCNEEVRLAAAEGIKTAAGVCCACSNGCSPTCCTEKIQATLMSMSRGEKDGCFNEPSARVRQAATSALAACPPLDKTGGDGTVEPGAVEPRTTSDPTPAEPSANNATLFQFGNYTWLPEAIKLNNPVAKPTVKRTVTKKKPQVAEKPLPAVRPEAKKKTSVLVVKYRPISSSKK